MNVSADQVLCGIQQHTVARWTVQTSGMLKQE